jgi:hypothetical protein
MTICSGILGLVFIQTDRRKDVATIAGTPQGYTRFRSDNIYTDLVDGQKDLSFTFTPITAALSNIKHASAGTSNARYGAQENDKGTTLY